MNQPAIKRVLAEILRHLDGMLLALLIAMLAVSVAVVFSASGESGMRLVGHLANIAVAMIVLVAVANVPPHILSKLGPPLYALALMLLLAVALFGEIRNGSRRWLSFGILSIQPSELMKIALPLMLAWYFQQHEAALRLRHYAVAALLIALPFLFILRQPDLGTSLLIAASGFYVLFFAGLSWKIIAGLAAATSLFLPIAWNLLHDYQRQRVMTLFDPMSDPLGAGYHIIQSTIAIGSGGAFGKGWLSGTQNQLDFVPERTTDFIFAVFSEEFGLLGVTLLLLLYLAIVARGLKIAEQAPTMFARLMAATISLNFFTYIFINMGMVSGILPVVGVPLPLMSYGGTALLTLMIGFGMLMSMATHRKLLKS
ncbi:MAG: rod shape-determining protein RodA [Pseudomonadota bacterium]